METEPTKIRVVIADDHPIVRDGLRKLLCLEDDIDVVGEAADGRELVERMDEFKPDVILLDLRMPNLDGLGALQTLQHTGQQGAGHHPDGVGRQERVRAGDEAGLLRHRAEADGAGSDREEHPQGALRRDLAGFAHHGGRDAAVRQRRWTQAARVRASKVRERSPLSTREREIVALVAQGYKNKEMAEKMFISEQTVKNHLHNIFDKLGVSDRLELALYAIHKGLHLQQGDQSAAGLSPIPYT